MDLQSVITEAQNRHIQAYIVAIDLEKAYDTVQWSALYVILEKFGFGPNFINMIRVCQSQIEGSVLNNGYRSEFFLITRGLRQGCPLSCLTFICVIEALGEKIRQEKLIQGIPCGVGGHKKLAQYADDLWIAMIHKKDAYLALFRILYAFHRFSGLKVNYNKTEILRIGSLRNTNAKYYSNLQLIWTDGPIKILGILCTGNVQEMRDLNFWSTLEKVENRLKIWNKRSLTLLGKIQVVNTLIVPLFIYRLSVIATPTKVQFAEYRKLISSFLWEGKKATNSLS